MYNNFMASMYNYYVASSVSRQDEQILWTVIGYPSGQDKIILPAQDYPLCPSVLLSYNKSFIDQAGSIDMAG